MAEITEKTEITETEDIQKKTYEEVAALKDLFLRRLMDDKIKSAALIQLKEENEALHKQLNDKALSAFVKELLLICDRIDAQEEIDDFTASVEEELLEVLARREIRRMPAADTFDPEFHNAVGTEEETDEFPEKSIVKVVRNGYLFRDGVFRSADVIVSVKKKEAAEAE